jgi:hypothetical protein
LVPVPEVASLAELKERIAAIDLGEDDRILRGQLTQHRVQLRRRGRSAGTEDFDCGLTLTPKVGRDSRDLL